MLSASLIQLEYASEQRKSTFSYCAWGPHRQQVVGVPVRVSCDSGGGQKGRALGGGSIHRLPPDLPGRNVVFSPLGARRSTAGTVVPGTYPTCSGGRWWAWFACGGLGGSGRLCVFQNRLYASRTSPSVGWRCPVWVAALRMWFFRSDLLSHSGCCRNETWCVHARARAVGLVTGPHARTPPHPQPVGSGPRQPAQRAGSRGWESARPRTPHTKARGAPPGHPHVARTARKASSQ